VSAVTASEPLKVRAERGQRPATAATNPVDEILALLGDDVVLVPNKRLTKIPAVNRWQKLTLESMRRPDHL
jgi:hypothetical protein